MFLQGGGTCCDWPAQGRIVLRGALLEAEYGLLDCLRGVAKLAVPQRSRSAWQGGGPVGADSSRSTSCHPLAVHFGDLAQVAPADARAFEQVVETLALGFLEPAQRDSPEIIAGNRVDLHDPKLEKKFGVMFS